VPPPQSVVPDLDPAFASIISKSMARDVNHRFQSTNDVLLAIDAWLRSGQAVTVPPEAETEGAGHLPKGARSAMSSGVEINAGAPGHGQGTAGSWATSQPDAPVAKKKSSGPVVAAALSVGFLLLAGGAFAAFSLPHKATPSADSAAAAQPPAAPVVAPESPHVVPAPAEVPAVVPSAEPAPVAPEKTSAVASAPRAVPAAHPAARPAAPAAKPAPAADKPAAPKPAGAPDFGY